METVPFAELVNASVSQIESLSKAELEEFERVNAETIAGLRKDIDRLKWRLKQFGPKGLPQLEYNQMLRQGGPDVLNDVKDRLKREIDEYGSRLKETMRLTEVTVDRFDRHVQILDDEHCVKEFRLEVTVYNRRVCLSCKMEEEFSTQAALPESGKVTWFQIQFQEDIHAAIGEDIKKAAEKIALHSSFSLLKSYLNWKKERDDIVVNLSQSYPKTLTLFTSGEGTYCLQITNPKPDRPVFTVEWQRKTVDGMVVPDVHMKVDAPDKWTAMDSENVLDSAPQIFETMITTLGLEKALEAFIQLVATDGRLPQSPSVEDSDNHEDGVS
ncbi:centromere protein p [Plakobranchus ocellatus]|uniref:Centromere protein p n=1 Tax=Plakobranchus ocellatus TaxID=259542 RepID=A0AAV4B4K0_9GAST|nr:centromere protein p [Plakobranchus ocellatus]